VTGTPNHVSSSPATAASTGSDSTRSIPATTWQRSMATTSGRPSAPVSMTSSDAAHGSQKAIDIPQEMSEPLAFFLGAYASGPHEPLDVDRDHHKLGRRGARRGRHGGMDGVRNRGQDPEAGRTGARAWRSPPRRSSSSSIPRLWGTVPRPSGFRMRLCVLLVTCDLLPARTGARRLYVVVPWPVEVGHLPRFAPPLDDLQAILHQSRNRPWSGHKAQRRHGKDTTRSTSAEVKARNLVEIVALPPKPTRRHGPPSAVADGAPNTADVVPGINPAELYSLVPYRQRKRFRSLRTHRVSTSWPIPGPET